MGRRKNVYISDDYKSLDVHDYDSVWKSETKTIPNPKSWVTTPFGATFMTGDMVVDPTLATSHTYMYASPSSHEVVIFDEKRIKIRYLLQIEG